MKIGFIGAGKVGFTLGKYFKKHGADVTGYYSKNPKSAMEAAQFTDTKCFNSFEHILTESDTLFLTVPDTVISEAWNFLKTMPIENKIICHCSGAISSSVFDGIAEKQAYGYSVHPFFAISSKLTSYNEMSQAFFTLEGSVDRIHILENFIKKMGNPVHIVTTQQKNKYHAAAVFLSNHVTALAYMGCKLLEECGFDEKMASIALNTLFLSNAEAVAKNGITSSLTGPVERNDLLTLKKHMDCLGDNEKEIYKLLSIQLIEIAQKKHCDYDYLNMELLLRE